MQLNGTLLYDPDPAQQGKNLFTDPIYMEYPTVQAFTQQVSSTQTATAHTNIIKTQLRPTCEQRGLLDHGWNLWNRMANCNPQRADLIRFFFSPTLSLLTVSFR
jgi:hypothetical protein